MEEVKTKRMIEALKRAKTLLVAVQEFISDNHFEDGTVFYDDAECDGYCLRDDANFAVEEIRETLAKATGQNTEGQ